MVAKFSKDKFLKLIYPALYIVLILGCVISGCFAFSKLYYESIYVSGLSMQPTLIGGYIVPSGKKLYHYGRADLSKQAINNLKRFDVVITSYPSDWGFSDETYIIKRIWGFPGEHISLLKETNQYVFTVYSGSSVKEKYVAPILDETIYDVNKTVTFTTEIRTFKTNGEPDRSFDRVLAKDEVFLMGDNWGHSTDCFEKLYTESSSVYLTKSHIKGKVISIDGFAELKDKTLVNKIEIKKMINF